MKRDSKFHWALISVVAGLANTTVMAADSRVIEEVIVTAQRVAEPESKVPIAMSAFNEAMIRDRQIVGLAELHINVPNTSFSPRVAGSQPEGDLGHQR